MAASSGPPDVLVDDWAHELDIEPPFVGRHRDIDKLMNALNGRYRLFGVFGFRAVGKSRFVKEVISRYTENRALSIGFENAAINTADVENENVIDTDAIRQNATTNINTTVIRLDLAQQTEISSVVSNLCACLGKKPERGNNNNDGAWVQQIVKHFKSDKKKKFILFFDNVENSEDNTGLSDGLKSLFWQLTYHCVHVKVFITSTTKFMTSRLKNIYFCHELLPLTYTESSELIGVIAPEVELGIYKEPIVKLSEGLPLLLSMIANELADDEGLITPKDMVEMLTTSRLQCLSRRDYYAAEDCPAEVYKKFIERLTAIYRRRLAVLGYIPGSFDVREAKEILGFATDVQAKEQALIPIRRRFMLSYDPAAQRFNIQGILRDCLDVYFSIRNIADVRKRYCAVFSAVMTELTIKMGTTEYIKAFAQFSLEQPNFQKLLKEVYYTTEDTYPFFITMATKCTDMIEQFLLKECDKFYDGCMTMADRYGTAVDKGMVNIAVGSMWTNAKGDLKKGEEHYTEAMKVLCSSGNRLQLATIYQRLGWNLHSQGQSGEAVRYFSKSLAISQNSGPDFQRLAQQSLNSLGVANTVLGNFVEAEKYHFAALKRAQTTYQKDHPSIGAVFNNIGLMYSTLGESEKALKYFLEGLEIKKKNKAPLISLLLSYSNVASEYSRCRMYEEAHKLLTESLQLIFEQDRPMRYMLAIIYDTMGKVLKSQKRYQEALTSFEKSADLREIVGPETITYVESLVHVAATQKCLGQHKQCLKTSKKVLALKKRAAETMPPNTFIAECYECLIEVHEAMGDDEKYLETLKGLEMELCRLEDVHMCACNDIHLEKVRAQLQIIRDKIQSRRGTKPGDEKLNNLNFRQTDV